MRAAALEAIEWRGRFRLVVPGGRTPEALFARLAAEDALRWDLVEIGFTDERAVPPANRESNYRLLRETLIEPLGERAPHVERMVAEWPDLNAAARECETWFREPADLVVLGMGEDGHVASLFPHSGLLAEHGRRVAAVFDAPKAPARRLTVTPRVLAEARSVLTLVAGGAKAQAAARALAREGSVAECPARLAAGGEWLIERAAATALR